MERSSRPGDVVLEWSGFDLRCAGRATYGDGETLDFGGKLAGPGSLRASGQAPSYSVAPVIRRRLVRTRHKFAGRLKPATSCASQSFAAHRLGVG